TKCEARCRHRRRIEAAAAGGKRVCDSERGACLIKKSHPVCFVSKAEVFAFIEVNRASHAVALMCRVYGVTRAGYYAWRHRAPSARATESAVLVQRIREVHRRSRDTYGSPRVHRALREAGERVGRHRVARLMQREGIKARAARLYRSNPGLHAF